MTQRYAKKYDLDREWRRRPGTSAEVTAACKGHRVRPQSVWLALHVLVHRADWSTGHVDSTLRQIADEAPLGSTDAAKRVLAVLVDLGWIRVVESHRSPGRGGGHGRGKVYHLDYLDRVLAERPALGPEEYPGITVPVGEVIRDANTGTGEITMPVGEVISGITVHGERITVQSGDPLKSPSENNYAETRAEITERAPYDERRLDDIARIARGKLTGPACPGANALRQYLRELARTPVERSRWPLWLHYGDPHDAGLAVASHYRGESVTLAMANALDRAVIEALRHDPWAPVETDDDHLASPEHLTTAHPNLTLTP